MNVAAIAAPLALLVAACGQSAFDRREGLAWSHSSGRPDGVSSAAYAIAVTTVDREQPGATIVVAGSQPASLSTLSYDVGGELELAGSDLDGAFPAAPAVAGALDPIAGGNGVVAIADGAGSLQVYDARTGDLGPAFRATVDAARCGGPGGFGGALVFALTDPEGDVEPELLALAGSEVAVLHDFDLDAATPACSHCALPGGEGAALATGTIDDDDGEDAVVLSAAGHQIAAFTAAQIAAQTGVDCGEPLVALSPPAADDAFAAPLAVGDIEDNDAPEIAVASPDHRVVFVFRDVGGEPADPVVIRLPAPADSSSFGAAIVFGDFDGDEVEELAVGDPDASPEGVAGAGQVTLYRYDGEELTPAATLYDSEPEEGQQFGRSLTVAEFGIGGADYRDLLVVGADGEVFTYFRSTEDTDDPRN